MLSRIVSGVSPGMNDARGDAERPGRGRDQERGRFDVAVEPAAGGELVLDQPVRGRGVGHAQQRLGQHHQRQALLGRQRISVQEIVDAAEPAGLGADRLDQPPRAGIDAALGGALARGVGEERCRQFLVRRSEGCLRKLAAPASGASIASNLSSHRRHCEEQSDAARQQRLQFVDAHGPAHFHALQIGDGLFDDRDARGCAGSVWSCRLIGEGHGGEPFEDGIAAPASTAMLVKARRSGGTISRISPFIG